MTKRVDPRAARSVRSPLPGGGRETGGNPVRSRIIADDEIKDKIANAHPYREWIEDNNVSLEDLPDAQD